MQSPPSDTTVQSLGQFSRGQDWRLTLVQDHPEPMLIWITRGQGRVLLDGLRRGTGTHNAIFVPAGGLFALDLGRQGAGMVVRFPAVSDLLLPEIPRLLRIREVQVQSELTGLIEAAQRERQAERPLRGDAMAAHAALMSVWIRRQIMLEEHIPEKRNAAGRLSQRFCARVSRHFASGAAMADHAAALGVTPTHLTRAVKAATGRTAAEILTERILYEARRLLVDTREPAQRIAGYLGFGSAAYFTRFIQHHTGQPPSKLRGTRPVATG